MKEALIHTHDMADPKRFDQVLCIHDDSLHEVDDAYVVEFKQIIAKAYERVTESLGLRCPMAGNPISGKTWLEAH